MFDLKFAIKIRNTFFFFLPNKKRQHWSTLFVLVKNFLQVPFQLADLYFSNFPLIYQIYPCFLPIGNFGRFTHTLAIEAM